MKRGITLVELLVGIATAAVAGVVSAQLFKLGVMTYNYTLRQNMVLTSASKAEEMPGNPAGMQWAIRGAYSLGGLYVSSLAVVSAGSVASSYYLSNQDLVRTAQGKTAKQAGPFNSLSVAYYNIGAAGTIIQSTAANAATLVTTTLTIQGRSNSQKTYTFFTGAQLRNHP